MYIHYKSKMLRAEINIRLKKNQKRNLKKLLVHKYCRKNSFPN